MSHLLCPLNRLISESVAVVLFGMPMEVIVGMGTKVNPAIHSVSTLVLFAVVPFNLLKGFVVSLLTFLLYKRISPILHRGDERRRQKHADRAAA